MADAVIGLGSYAETDVASATTSDIGAAPTLKVRITGTTSISSFGSSNNRIRFVRFADALTLNYNIVTLNVPTSANIAVEAGDTCVAMSGPSGNWLVTSYHRKSGRPLGAESPSFTGTFLHTNATATATFTTAWQFVRTGGSTSSLNVKGEGTTISVVDRADASVTSAEFRRTKSRGTLASPAVIIQNDEVGTDTWRAYDGAGLRTVASQIVFVTAATPASGDMEARWVLSMCAAGSGSVSEALRFDHATGLSMFGANIVIGPNRHLRFRSYTFATVPSASPATQAISISNRSGRPAWSDGTDWRFADGVIIS